jgi:hypothetical protein
VTSTRQIVRGNPAKALVLCEDCGALSRPRVLEPICCPHCGIVPVGTVRLYLQSSREQDPVCFRLPVDQFSEVMAAWGERERDRLAAPEREAALMQKLQETMSSGESPFPEGGKSFVFGGRKIGPSG